MSLCRDYAFGHVAKDQSWSQVRVAGMASLCTIATEGGLDSAFPVIGRGSTARPFTLQPGTSGVWPQYVHWLNGTHYEVSPLQVLSRPDNLIQVNNGQVPIDPLAFSGDNLPTVSTSVMLMLRASGALTDQAFWSYNSDTRVARLKAPNGFDLSATEPLVPRPIKGATWRLEAGTAGTEVGAQQPGGDVLVVAGGNAVDGQVAITDSAHPTLPLAGSVYLQPGHDRDHAPVNGTPYPYSGAVVIGGKNGAQYVCGHLRAGGNANHTQANMIVNWTGCGVSPNGNFPIDEGDSKQYDANGVFLPPLPLITDMAGTLTLAFPETPGAVPNGTLPQTGAVLRVLFHNQYQVVPKAVLLSPHDEVAVKAGLYATNLTTRWFDVALSSTFAVPSPWSLRFSYLVIE